MARLALITGITGQDGSYLAEFLLEKGYKVYGIVRRSSSVFNFARLENIKDKIKLHYGDLSDGSSLGYTINNIIQDNENFEIFEIYNLAAQSHVQISFETPEYTSTIDGIGTLKILEIIRQLSPENKDKIRFYQAGTSEMFGKVLQIPQTEDTPFNPQSPYACAKLYSHYIVRNYRDAYNIYACNGILFNHESPRRGNNFVTKKIVNIVKQLKEPNTKDVVLKLGNINSKRDWGHAKDYIKGMWLMLQQDNSDDYILSSEKTYTIREFVERTFKTIDIEIEWQGIGLDEIGIDKNTQRRLIQIDKKYFRPCEVDILLGDCTKAKENLGWKCEYDTLDKLIDSMMNDE